MNYFVGVFLLLEVSVIEFLVVVKEVWELLVEDLCDVFVVLYEIVVYCFINFVIWYFGLFVYFFKVYESGLILKVYENDGVVFLIDVFGVVEG